MKKAISAIFALATALAISPVVLAGQSTNFTLNINDGSGLQLNGTGTYSTQQAYNPNGSGTTGSPDGYLITSFSGTISAPGAPIVSISNATLISSSNPGGLFLSPAPAGGQFQVDDLLFPGNNVTGPDSGYFDNLGLLLNVVGENALGNVVDYEVNIFTGSQNGIYPGPAGVPYQVVYSDGYYTVAFTPAPDGPSVSVPEYSGLSMLILSALTLAPGLFFKTRQPGLFLAA